MGEPILDVVEPEAYRACTACGGKAWVKIGAGTQDEYGSVVTSIVLCEEHGMEVANKLGVRLCAVCGPVPVCTKCKGDDSPIREK